MHIDQRIEALTISIQALTVNIESLHSSVGELHGSSQRHDAELALLVAAAAKDGENIRALARVAEIHERRLTDIEGSDSNA